MARFEPRELEGRTVLVRGCLALAIAGQIGISACDTTGPDVSKIVLEATSLPLFQFDLVGFQLRNDTREVILFNPRCVDLERLNGNDWVIQQRGLGLPEDPPVFCGILTDEVLPGLQAGDFMRLEGFLPEGRYRLTTQVQREQAMDPISTEPFDLDLQSQPPPTSPSKHAADGRVIEGASGLELDHAIVLRIHFGP